jgi:peptidoglycan/LPS O-acetylase OafA/YrhL
MLNNSSTPPMEPPLLSMQTHLTIASALSGRKNNFDIIRFIAASLVIVAHAYVLNGENPLLGPFARLTGDQMTFGTLGVSIFFMISGFLILQSFTHSKTIGHYALSRILRIFPALIVLVLLTVFVLGSLVTQLPLANYLSHAGTYDYLKTVFLFPVRYELPGVFTDNVASQAVNGSLWTLAYELLCYIMVAIAGVLGLLRYKVIILITFILLLTAHLATHFTTFFSDILKLWWRGIGFKNLLELSTFFVAGMCIYAYREHIKISHLFAVVALFALILFGYFGLLRLGMMIFGSYLVFYLAFNPAFKAHNFAKNGDLSYGIYIYAFPVQQVIFMLFGGQMDSSLLNFMLAFPITYLLAWCSWHGVEKWALHLKKRFR